MKPDQERCQSTIKETISLLCKRGLNFARELKIEGVIGVTVDRHDIFIVHINDLISQTDSLPTSNRDERVPKSLPQHRGSTRKVRAPRPLPPMMRAARMPQICFPPPGVRPTMQPNSRMSYPRMTRKPQRMVSRGSGVAPRYCREPTPFQQISRFSSGSAKVNMPMLQKFSPMGINLPVSSTSTSSSVGGAADEAYLHHMFGQKEETLMLREPDAQREPEFENPSRRKSKSCDSSFNDNDTNIPDIKVKPKTELDTLHFSCESETAEAFNQGRCDPDYEELMSKKLLSEVKQESQDVTSALLFNSGMMSYATGSTDQREMTDEHMTIERSSYFLSSSETLVTPGVQCFQEKSENVHSESDLSSHERTGEESNTDEEKKRDPDWSSKKKMKKKSRTKPKKTASQFHDAAGWQQFAVPHQLQQLSPMKRHLPMPFSEGPQSMIKFARSTAAVPHHLSPIAMPFCEGSQSIKFARSTAARSGGDDGSWKVVERFMCTLPECGASFTAKNSLVRHQRRRHGMGEESCDLKAELE